MHSTALRRILYIVFSLGVMLALSGGLVLALDSSQPMTPAESIREALELAREQPSMHIDADVQQTVIPRAVSANVGESEEHYAFRVLGDVTQRTRLDGMEDRRARMMFQVGGQAEAMELLLVNNDAYVGYQGKWQPIDDPAGGVAPAGDYLGYLNAVVHVTEMEPVATEQGVMRRYSFDLDGKLYAEYQLQRMKLALAGKLPQGAELATSPAQEAMTGAGELWVDESGLPRRQVLDVNMPGVSTGYDAEAMMVIDFSRYGDPVPGIQAPQPNGVDGELALPETPPAAMSSGEGAISSLGLENEAIVDFVRPFTATTARILVILPMLALIVLLMRRRRTIYAAVAWAMVAMIVVQPLVQASQYTGFSKYLSGTTTLNKAFEDVGALSMFADQSADPAQSLLADQAQSASGGELQDCRSFDKDPDLDYDGDGLSNADEWCLGTQYEGNEAWDSDGDLITDTLEVNGFMFNGILYTTDPLQRDTNGDGMSDGQEWKPSITDPTQFQRFMDLDDDKIPNPWDKDNDGDGVPDAQDISPYSTDNVLGYRPAMNLKINTVHTGTTVYVDIAVQPKETAQLRYNLTSLDWPPDDQGQIQDLDNSTDDITMFPILSFTSNFTPTLADEYGISEPGAKGAFWAPLQPVEEAGNIYAYSTRIAYTNQEIKANLGLNLIGGAEILWMTQAMFDEWADCKDPDNPTSTTCAVKTTKNTLATYPGGDFRVTGLNVSESKDVQVGLFGTQAPEISLTGAWDEDYVMGKVMNKGMGLYLHYENPDLINILDNQDTTFAGWGITPTTLMNYTATTYPHRDEALATTGTTTTLQFLDSKLHALQCYDHEFDAYDSYGNTGLRIDQ